METCCIESIHENAIQKVKPKMPSDDDLLKLSDLYKAMGDLTRIRIISALVHSEMCVCDLAALLEMTQSAISHQLRVLRQTHLVSYRKEGKVVYYSLDDDHIKMLYEQGLVHVLHQH
ncbi:MAG: metalloregulator ArsR/SmtB family transcription factor [Turicibacter sp.]|jgi:ArsR family transcriptional regulator|nr:metalloregulator ArsR/SmtB family transcription factor [Turicibacter sp.]